MINILKHIYHYFIIKRSGLFDRSFYLKRYPDLKKAKAFPLVHFMRFGWREGRDPNPEFHTNYYLNAYQDVEYTSVNPLVHYILFGRYEGRKTSISKTDYSAFIKQLLTDGNRTFDQNLDTILVVSHEASRTGAPILSLNIAQEMQKKFNVVSILLGDGPLVRNFLDTSVIVAGPIPPPQKYSAEFAVQLVEKLCEAFKIRFAIVNSIESHIVLQGLARAFIPSIHLIHEFASYTNPKNKFLEAAFWSHKTIFSTAMTYENAILVHPELSYGNVTIIPQGIYNLPETEFDSKAKLQEDLRINEKFRPASLPSDAIIVLGVGTVNYRKGVDLFISCAAWIARNHPELHIRFIWVGGGYDPENDIEYSAYLREQIHRSKLGDTVLILDNTPNIDTAYDLSDLLLISSRLDPLPGVAFEAMSHKLPVLCFEQATGIAEILIDNGLKDDCVARYMDIEEMSAKILKLSTNSSKRELIGEKLHRIVTEKYQLQDYIRRLEEVILNVENQVDQEKKDSMKFEGQIKLG